MYIPFSEMSENKKSKEDDDIILAKYIAKMAKDIEELKKLTYINSKPINITINIESEKDWHSFAEAVIKNLKESGTL
ncbi:hypothetical protein [Clostridium sporogenes]|uniref:hypothetical protein n=1 Tax=Clostridium sporogenes TaxID=1509 RepID=UPI0013CFCAEF|nr:hypothetical protein [Clostridium sporogenes]NFH40698.1 hypothetical protein [Clostridium sporogenes]